MYQVTELVEVIGIRISKSGFRGRIVFCRDRTENLSGTAMSGEAERRVCGRTAISVEVGRRPCVVITDFNCPLDSRNECREWTENSRRNGNDDKLSGEFTR